MKKLSSLVKSISCVAFITTLVSCGIKDDAGTVLLEERLSSGVFAENELAFSNREASELKKREEEQRLQLMERLNELQQSEGLLTNLLSNKSAAGEFVGMREELIRVRSEIQRVQAELQKSHRALSYLDGQDLDDFNNVRALIFPVMNGKGEVPTSNNLSDRKYFTLRNDFGLLVESLNRASGQRELIGEAVEVKFQFHCPGELQCESGSQNRLLLLGIDDDDSTAEVIEIDPSLMGLEVGTHALVVRPKYEDIDYFSDDVYDYGLRVQSPEDTIRLREKLRSLGITEVKYHGFLDRNRNKNQDATEPSEKFHKLYRGHFEVFLGNAYVTDEMRTWLGVNVVPLEEYLYSVVSSENGGAPKV